MQFKITLLLNFIFLSAFGQDTLITNIYQFSENRLSNIASVAKDNKNFIWTASQNGIFRFDSKTYERVKLVESDNSEADWMAYQKVICNTTNNEVVVLSAYNGIAILREEMDSSRFVIPAFPKELDAREIVGLELISDKYILSTKHNIFLVDILLNAQDKPFVKIIEVKENVDPICVRSAGNGKLVVFNSQKVVSLFELKGDSLFRKFHLSIPVEVGLVDEVFSIFFNGRSIFLATNAGLFIISGTEGKLNFKHMLNNRIVYAIDSFNGYDMWVATEDGLYKYDFEERVVLVLPSSTALDRFWLRNVYAITQTDENEVWLGCQNGLAMIRPVHSPFYSIVNSSSDNRMLNHVYHINAIGDKLVISSDKGLFSFKKKVGVKTLIPDSTFFLSFQINSKTTIVSGLSATYVIDRKKLVNLKDAFPEFRHFDVLSFNDCENYHDSILFLSTENNRGVLMWDVKRKRVSPLTYKDGTELHQVNTLFLDGANLFVLTDSMIVNYNISKKSLSPRFLKKKSPEDFYFKVIFDMKKSGGAYYFACYGFGLVVTDTLFNVTKVINESNGLSDNGVYRILISGDSSLIISSNNGLTRYDLRKKEIRRYYTEDGLHGNQFEEFSSFDNGTKLYFGGTGGITEVDPLLLTECKVPSNFAFTECLLINDNNFAKKLTLFGKGQLSIPNNISATSIGFQNITYPPNSQIIYRYRIRQVNNEWITLGTQNVITLVGLSPGKYNLDVQVLNKEGQLQSQYGTIELIWQPKWFQTLMAKMSFIAILIGMGYAIYKRRIAELKREQEIKNKIASDLHDDLGSTVNSVKIYVNLALLKAPEDSYLLQIKESVQQAIVSIRDIIWILDDEQNSVEQLLLKLKTFAFSLCQASNIEYLEDISDDCRDYHLDQGEKRNLFMILKEAINNTVKYANASRVQISVGFNQQKLFLIVKDNGKGFVMNKSVAGNGLKNMKRRSLEIHYTIEIDSFNGTTISLLKN